MQGYGRRWWRNANGGKVVGRLALDLVFVLLAAPFVAQAEPRVYESLEPPEAPVRLRTEPAPDDPVQLRCRFNAGQLAILEKLNRVDVDHLTRLKQLIVPDRWDLRELDYSPLPQESAWAAGLVKALVVHQPMQVFGAYARGVLVRWGPVSSGAARRPTPAGLFYLNWKSKGRASTVNPAWFLRWYFNFVNKDGISFHEYALPGRPASHGCVRMLGRDARWLYEWGEEWKLGPRGWTISSQGTPVWILGEAEYVTDPPWQDREYLAAAGQVSLGGPANVFADAERVADADETAGVHVAVGGTEPDGESKEPGSI